MAQAAVSTCPSPPQLRSSGSLVELPSMRNGTFPSLEALMKASSPYCMTTLTVSRSIGKKLCAIALSIMLISSHVRPANSSVVYQRVLQTNGDSSSGGLIPSSAVRSTMSTLVMLHVIMGWFVGLTVGSPLRPDCELPDCGHPDTTATEQPTGLSPIG
eukprot:GHVS01108881.1.p1 GENE.GHVS01108881.1~~GHVS01108881.1.p1  ORF type:complete len:158 (+),score=21.28 GHVS01108881.1:57-530(+)